MITAATSFDCDSGMVTVTVNNSGPTTFTGQSATAGSWIVSLSIPAGQSQSITAKFLRQTQVDGYIQGHYDGDPAFVSVPWHAVRGCPLPTTTTQPVDTTPHPVIIGTDPTPVCIVPGSPTQEPVPCDSPRATTPDVPTTPPTEPPAASPEPTAAPVSSAPAVGTQARTGPPRTHQVVAQQPKQAELPVTGTSPALALTGTLALLLGCFLVWKARRRPEEMGQEA